MPDHLLHFDEGRDAPFAKRFFELIRKSNESVKAAASHSGHWHSLTNGNP